MKIAHVTYGLGMGGIETMLVNIANEQTAAGHEVHIIVINAIVDRTLVSQISTRVNLHLLDRPQRSRNPIHLLRLNGRLERIRPDVVHLHYASISRYIALPSMRKRLCVTLHALCRPSNIVWIDRSGPIFAISEMVKADISAKLGLKSDTVCNGINIARVTRRPSGKTPSVPFKIVQVSRLLMEEKGQDILIRAVAGLISSGRKITLTLIGEGPSRADLEKLARSCGIAGAVEFLGSRPQPYVLSRLASYDLFVQPSRFEGFGLTVAEAMAARVPVLVSDNNAPMEVIGNGSFGFHFKGGSHEDCARMIARIMDNYPGDEFLDEAAARVEQHYNIKRTASRYLELYDSKVVNRAGI